MKLFWKVYTPVFISFMAVVFVISYVSCLEQIADAEHRLFDESTLISDIIAKEMEVEYLESKWPFESLQRLAKRDSFLFWWVVRDDGLIHLAHDITYTRTDAYGYFPNLIKKSVTNGLFVDRRRRFGVCLRPLAVGRHGWSFWLGFSTEDITSATRHIVLATIIVSLGSLILVGGVLYAIIMHFVRRVQKLTICAAAVGEGNLSCHVSLDSNDELGLLAKSFNKMTDNLQKTTVTKTFVDSIINNMSEILIVTDRQLTIKLVNPATKHVLHYEDQELIEKPLALILSSKGDSLGGPLTQDLLTQKVLHSREATLRAKDGREIPVLFSASPLWDRNRSQTNIVCTARDITERKLAEGVLVRQAQELARSNTDLEQFAYMASHDLQEPLRMVTSYLRLLASRYRDKLDHEADAFIGYAADGAARMRTLINDLLAYSRVGTRGKPFAPTDCVRVLATVLANLEVAITETGAVVTADRLPVILADEAQLIQVFQNLIGNAIKFHASDRPVIQISAERLGAEWLFSVCDNGIGIDSRHAERIFLAFQRLHGAEHHQGSGIGLAICKKIVARHGGRIWVESEEGKGSVFRFTVPANDGIGPAFTKPLTE